MVTTNSLVINDDMMLPCPKGRYREGTLGDAVKSCTNCPAGRYRDRNKGKDEEGCKACPIGKYAAVTGSVQVSDCLRCPAGKTAAEEGMGECTCITDRSCARMPTRCETNPDGCVEEAYIMSSVDTFGESTTFFEEYEVTGEPGIDYFRESVPYIGRS